MITGKAIPRRTILKGMGTAIALPFLDAMTPALAYSKAPGETPVRMMFVYVPNGVMMEQWNPNYEGKLRELPRVLKSLEPLKDDILLLGNLTNNAGRAWLDGPGDHGRCCGSYLTSVHVRKTTTDILSGVSCDYTNNLAWKSETQALPPILNPRQLFERLFGSGVALSPEERARQSRIQRSVMDMIAADTKLFQKETGPTDKRKLDEYLTSIREIERQLEKAEQDKTEINPGMEKPYGIPSDFAEHFKLMTDMVTVAFQADLTRVVTFIVTREGTSRSYREIGIPDGHHPLTHHRNDPTLMEKVAQINTYHMQQFATWVARLKAIKEGDSTLLDNSMIVYGAGLSDGNRHTHEDLPTIIVGRGMGRSSTPLNTGRRMVVRKETPMCNLFLTMMD